LHHVRLRHLVLAPGLRRGRNPLRRWLIAITLQVQLLVPRLAAPAAGRPYQVRLAAGPIVATAIGKIPLPWRAQALGELAHRDEAWIDHALLIQISGTRSHQRRDLHLAVLVSQDAAELQALVLVEQRFPEAVD